MVGMIQPDVLNFLLLNYIWGGGRKSEQGASA